MFSVIWETSFQKGTYGGGLGKSTRKDVKWFDTIVRKLIEGVTAHDEKYVVEFKSGIEIDVRL